MCIITYFKVFISLKKKAYTNPRSLKHSLSFEKPRDRKTRL